MNLVKNFKKIASLLMVGALLATCACSSEDAPNTAAFENSAAINGEIGDSADSDGDSDYGGASYDYGASDKEAVINSVGSDYGEEEIAEEKSVREKSPAEAERAERAEIARGDDASEDWAAGDDYEADYAADYAPEPLSELPSDGKPSSDSQTTNSAGLLTGGEWNDNNDWNFWTGRVLPKWGDYAAKWELNPANRITARAVDRAGKPVKNAKIELVYGETVLWTAKTDREGTAYLFYDFELDGQSQGQSRKAVNASEFLVKATSPDGSKRTSEEVKDASKVVEIEFGDAYAQTEKSLDLMLMCDTTGSMGDELSYLQTELESVINSVNRTHTDASIRLSVNFYRDKGDDYVVLPYEFTSDVPAAINVLNRQEASGGDDYPEAVDLALLNAINEHDWASDSVKLMFIVLDAPPHYNAEVIANLKQAIYDASERGIRIIPVASSGVDTDTEFLLRTFAMTTGGTYTFLTDHSGVGGSHLEPTIGAYKVEKLNEMLIRIIGEYLG